MNRSINCLFTSANGQRKNHFCTLPRFPNSEFIALIADKLQLQLKSAEAAQY